MIVADATINVHNIRDYHNVMNLCQEHNIEVKSVSSIYDDTIPAGQYSINITGDEDYIKFVRYLLKKQQEETTKCLRELGVK